jgi:hypothetical protein
MTQPIPPSSGAGVEAPVVEPKKPEKASLLDDFMDIFYAPSAVFARRGNASFWVPLLVVTVLLAAVAFANRDLMQPIMDAEFTRAMAKNPQMQQMTPEQLDKARSFSSSFGMIFIIIATPIAILVLGLVTWLVGKFVDASQTLNAAFVVAAFSYIPRVVEGIVNRVQGLIIDPASINSRYSLSLGIGRFLDPDKTSQILLAIVGRIDVFTIWITVLIAIGLAVTGKISRGRAAIAAVVIWVLGALPQLATALRA